MATDYFASGVFGIILDEAELGQVCTDLIAEAAAKPEDDGEGNYIIDAEWYDQLADKFHDRIVARFAELGVKIPDGAFLSNTGTEDEHPGRCATSANEWIMGFGIWNLTNPSCLKDADESFLKAAELHTWVTYG